MIRYFSAFSFFLLSFNFAQLPVTEPASLVDPKVLQLEFGIFYEKLNSTDSNFALPASTIHYGLNSKLELFVSNSFNFNVENEISSSNYPLTFGAKTPIFKNDHTKFSIAGYATLHIERHKMITINPSVQLLYAQQINSKVSVETNLGEEYDVESTSFITNYSAVAGFSLHPKIETFIEIYGNFSPEYHQHHYLNGGLSYSFTDQFQLTGSGGFGLSEFSTQYFMYLGAIILVFDKN